MKKKGLLTAVLWISLLLCGCRAEHQEIETGDIVITGQQETQEETSALEITDETIAEEREEPAEEEISPEVPITEEPVAEALAAEEPEAAVEPETEEKPEPEAEAATEPEVSGPEYNDGTYEGRALGFNANITVSVTVSGDTITDIAIVSHAEDEPYWTNAQKIIGTILSADSTDVDTVSGATFTSQGIIDAVNNALEKAKG